MLWKLCQVHLPRARLSPDDNDDAVKNVVRVVQVVEAPEGGELEDHLQGEHTGEDDVADLQDVSQLLRLGGKKKPWMKMDDKD